MPEALCIAIVGAESTGKTALAQALSERLRAETGKQVTWVPEMLRGWCESAGRTPLAHEQASILRLQHEQITAAAAAHDMVVCDTTALMTAVYSEIVFQDLSLHARAALLHRRHVRYTLLTAIDLPWVADGLQRAGPQVQAPADNALRALMSAQGIGFSVVSGRGKDRLAHAMAALAPVLRDATQVAPADDAGPARWRCADCGDADCERRLFRLADARRQTGL